MAPAIQQNSFLKIRSAASPTPMLRSLFITFLAGLVLFTGCRSVVVEDAGRDSLVIDDVSRLNPTRVKEILRPEKIETLREALERARAQDLKVSIAGKRHSQGGHIVAEGSLFLDMTSFDQVLTVDTQNRSVTVESGATWAKVQEAIHRFGYAVAVMQSANIFTIGGSLGSNAHGRDPNRGPIIESVRSFRLLTPDGKILHCDRSNNSDLFRLAIGGFGLFGVILDVELEMVPNALYERHIMELDFEEYPMYFDTHVRGQSDVGLHSGRLSISPGGGFLRDMYVRTYRIIAKRAEYEELRGESNVRRDQFFFDLSRNYGWGKSLRWFLQKTIADVPGQVITISRNNAMRPPIEFLRYRSETDTDILQEYFVPLHSFVEFVDGLRAIFLENEVNLLHATTRFVPRNEEAYLSYATEDMIAIVLYMNIGLAPEEIIQAQEWTRKVVELAHSNGGRYFLVYQGFPSWEQGREAYPKLDRFFELKKKYDPEMRFMNQFYERYGPGKGVSPRS